MGMFGVLPGNGGKPPDFLEKVRRRFPWDSAEVKVARAAGTVAERRRVLQSRAGAAALHAAN
jgi:hypothetical protein